MGAAKGHFPGLRGHAGSHDALPHIVHIGQGQMLSLIHILFQGGIIARGTPDELKGKAPGAAKNGGAADMTLEEAFIAYIEEVQRKGGHA